MELKTRIRVLLALSVLGLVAVLAGYVYWSPLRPVKSAAALVAFGVLITLGHVLDDTF
jgi:hypothetical protein